jgi:hypothetical protein
MNDTTQMKSFEWLIYHILTKLNYYLMNKLFTHVTSITLPHKSLTGSQSIVSSTYLRQEELIRQQFHWVY